MKNELQLIDTHCHLYHDDLQQDIHDIIERAIQAGVKTILLPAITLESIPLMDKLQHPGIQFGKMAGVHPCNIDAQTIDHEMELEKAVYEEEIIGVGETGLDYYWSTEYVTEQQRSFRWHCKLAAETGKPIVIHNRNSTEDMLRIFAEEQDGRITGVWHCFNGTYEEGMKAIDLGLHLGLGGVLTYKNSGLDLTVPKLPVDRLLLETDSPYLSPVPYRGKRNEPAFVLYVAEKLAEIMGMSLFQVADLTSRNAKNLFARLASNPIP
jgi:TatD DNase family protein